MTVQPPYPELDKIITQIGEAGRRLSEIEATEGAAGNISAYLGWPLDPSSKFPIQEEIELPEEVPELAGGVLLLTGSGRRLREIQDNPMGSLGAVVVNEDGRTAHLYTSPHCLFERLTTELNSHLSIHRDTIRRSPTNFHAVVHAQPLHLTYLSHIPHYQDETTLNRHILRWQPEIIVNLPEGIGYVPFLVPGSSELMTATKAALRAHRVVLWAKHGVIARSDRSVKRASDRIEYAETGARYEYLNLMNDEQGEGLTVEEMRIICRANDIEQDIF